MSKAENGVILGAICQHAQSNFLKIIIVIYATYAVAKRKPEKKNSGLYGIRTLDLCYTGAALYQLS